jgi:protein SCO1/2
MTNLANGGIKRPWLWSLFALVLLTIPATATMMLRARKPALPSYGQVPAFSLTDQSGAPFDSRALAGKVWVADFVFTSCSAICPRLTEEMARLQRHLVNRGADARTRLVSFTVDPERDTPERLQAYAAGFLAQPSLWKFLTGPSKTIEAAVVDGFKQAIEKEKDKDAVDGFSILHGSKFALVDGGGTIRGFYDSTDATSMSKLRDDIAALLERGGI